MDCSIRLRTADDDLAEKRADLKTLVTPVQKLGRQKQASTVVVRRGDKLVRVPVSQANYSCDGA